MRGLPGAGPGRHRLQALEAGYHLASQGWRLDSAQGELHYDRADPAQPAALAAMA